MERGMAEAAGQPEVAQPAHLPDAGGHQGTSSPSSTIGWQQARGTSMGCGHQQGHDPSRRSMELPAVVGGDQTTGPGFQTAHDHANDAQDPGDAGGPSGQQPTRGPVQAPEDGSGHHPLVAPADTQGNRGLGLDGRPMPQHSMVVAGHVSEEAQPEPITPGSPAPTSHREGHATTRQEQRSGEEPQGQVERLTAAMRHELRERALQVIYDNPGNTCYATSSFQSLIWASLSRLDFRVQDWGARSAILQDVLQHGDGEPFSLEHEPWFTHLIQGWIADGEQADSAEFTHMLASWTAMTAISNCWERRVQTEESTLLHDSGDKYMPLTLQLDPTMIHQHEVHLSALLRSWNTELGMMAGLSDPEDLLLLQIDRLVHHPNGSVCKCQAAIRFDWEVQVPVWRESNCDWIPFTIVACIAHFGADNSGHYQSMLRVFPEASNLAAPAMWMACDDGRAPERCLMIPEAFASGITCLWLCRSEQVDMHRLSPLPAQPGTDDAAILALLASQPDPEP